MPSLATDDIAFIGAGIASLYAAYQCLKKHPHLSVAVYEKSSRAGGRFKTSTWNKIEIMHGASVVRMEKDKRLKQLCRELGVELRGAPKVIDSSQASQSSQSSQNVNVLEIFELLRERAIDIDTTDKSFKQFATSVLGRVKYERLVDAVGYSDYEQADVRQTLNNYGIEDTVSGGTTAPIPINAIIDKLVAFIRARGGRFHFNHTVKSLGEVNAKKVVLGLTINATRKLLNAAAVFNADSAEYGLIGSQPFARVFAKLAQPIPCKGYTVIGRPLQKIIPLGGSIYMVAYADNESARTLRKLTKSQVQTLLRNKYPGATIVSMKKVYWEEGTHFFHPHSQDTSTLLKSLQNPMPNVYVIGEAFSQDQGWTEGALNSAHAVMRKILSP